MSSRPDCIFKIHQLWQSVFSRVCSNCCCSCLFEPEIIKIGQSSHKVYSDNILNFQESTPILNASTKKKKVWKLIEFTTYVQVIRSPREYNEGYVNGSLMVFLAKIYYFSLSFYYRNAPVSCDLIHILILYSQKEKEI